MLLLSVVLVTWERYPVCDQGLLFHPGAVTLVAGIRAPDPDQNQPWMFLGWRWGACAEQ